MDKLIVSLDVSNFKQACELVDVLSSRVNNFKVGIVPFTNFGEALLDKLKSLQKNVFLDLKFHDIPNTVRNAARAAAQKGIYMMNFHCLGGMKMLQAAVEGVREAHVSHRPLLLGVTILTSMNMDDMRNIGLNGALREKVFTLAKLAKDAGLDGVVASAEEAGMIKEELGRDFVVVTPGIRPTWALANKEDQKRVLTPKQAVAEGADYIVVGRPIIQARDPSAAADKIITELEEGNV